MKEKSFPWATSVSVILVAAVCFLLGRAAAKPNMQSSPHQESGHQESTTESPDAVDDEVELDEGADQQLEEGTLELATFGGGCFWCTEAIFDSIEGVYSVKSGFSGGRIENPTYEQICNEETGHAEVVQVAFDPDVVSYAKLLEVFMQTHDPTTLNRQGADVGTQYRSVILFHDQEQQAVAEEVITRLSDASIWPNPIVTEVVEYEAFYPAGEKHQDYFARNEESRYCQAVIQPKVEKFRDVFADLLKQNSEDSVADEE